MLNTIRDFASDVGCSAGDLAKRVGSGTAGVAKRVGRRTTDLAEDIGFKRALIGLAIVGAAVGGAIMITRYVRAKRAETVEPENEMANGSSLPKRRKADPLHTH